MRIDEAQDLAFRHEGVTYYAVEHTFVVKNEEGLQAVVTFGKGTQDGDPYNPREPWWELSVGQFGSGELLWVSAPIYDRDLAMTSLEQMLLEELWVKVLLGEA